MGTEERSARSRRIRVIGFGCGPDQLTAEAVAALRSVDHVIAADKGGDAQDPLLAVRREICAAYDVELVTVPDPERDRDDPADYPRAVRDWHAARVAAYDAALAERGGDVGFLVWGDPALYDSTLRVVDRLAQRHGLEVDVVPGVSALQLLAARHRLVLHEVGRPLLVTTGRRLLADALDHDNLVVFLDGQLTCRRLLEGGDTTGAGWRVWWGANLGTPSERLVAGPLAEVLPAIEEARQDARVDAGWVMDTYLLRRPDM